MKDLRYAFRMLLKNPVGRAGRLARVCDGCVGRRSHILVDASNVSGGISDTMSLLDNRDLAAETGAPTQYRHRLPEVAMSLVLLVGMTLCARSLHHARRIDFVAL